MPMRAVYVDEDVIADWENQDLELMRPYRDNLNAINATYLLSILISLILVRIHGTASPALPQPSLAKMPLEVPNGEILRRCSTEGGTLGE
jgi:hypothetical protein